MQDTFIGIWFAYTCLYKFLGPTLHLGQGLPQRPCQIRHQFSVVTIGVPVIPLEDSRPQDNLKFHHFSSLDYRARHGLLVTIRIIYVCNPTFTNCVVTTFILGIYLLAFFGGLCISGKMDGIRLQCMFEGCTVLPPF